MELLFRRGQFLTSGIVGLLVLLLQALNGIFSRIGLRGNGWHCKVVESRNFENESPCLVGDCELFDCDACSD